MRWILACALVGCGASAPAEPPPPAPAGARPAPDAIHPRDGTPIPCEREADCRHPACGPCSSGDTIVEQDTRKECFRNPCAGQTATCREHVCVVR